ncbi:response regulator transcription factor [Kocuria atrinae]|uniref:response regulator transcription factor n=1 Tax=Kocuria atrinae TaxID=592377 RepID=UPI0002F3FC8F|nr:response regulator transcription factor [Kocuria atrinae]
MIVDAVRDVMNDTMVLSPSVVELLADQVTQSPTTRSPAASAEAPDLTEREQQVVELIAGGLNNKEIAQELHLSEGAGKLHVGKACDRLGARDRVQLLVRAVECGLVTPSLLRPETARDRYR